MKKVVCPRCGEKKMRPVLAENALSRKDNKTYVCSDCGLTEAFIDFYGLEDKEWAIPIKEKSNG